MNRKIFFGAVAATVYALKWHYSHASVEGLRWILGPTAALVEALTGAGFEYEAGVGYLSTRQHFLIAPVCAGVNFFIAVFLTGCLGFFRRVERVDVLLGLSLAGAYAATVCTNALRIVLALKCGSMDFVGLSDAAAHRLLGVVVYTASLCTLFLCTLAWRTDERQAT